RAKDGAVGSADQADEQHGDKMADGGAAEQQDGDEDEHGVELRRQGTVDRLQNGAVRQSLEILQRALADVLADAVEDDNRILQAEAGDGKHGGQEERVYLPTEKQAGDGNKAKD